MSELSYEPYGSYAVLKFPQLFQKHSEFNKTFFESTLKKVQFDDIYDFVLARKENLRHLEDYTEKFSQYFILSSGGGSTQQSYEINEKILGMLQSILKKAHTIYETLEKTPGDQSLFFRHKELNPERLIPLIKVGDLD